MRRTNVFLIIALALALLASLTLNPISIVSAQNGGPVGVVVAYTPGQSITIVDQKGNQNEYMLAASLKILPPGAANSLAVGSFVTIIAPASLINGKEMAVGIVVHPHVPPGWNVPALTATPFLTGTPSGTEIASPTGTPPTETPAISETPTPVETGTLTETPPVTPSVTLTETTTPTPTPSGGGTTVTTNTFMDWLRSLLSQLLSKS